MILSSMSVMLRHVMHFEAPALEEAAEDVVGEHHAAVADVGVVINRGPTDVHRHLLRVALLERDHFSLGGVIKAHVHEARL